MELLSSRVTRAFIDVRMPKPIELSRRIDIQNIFRVPPQLAPSLSDAIYDLSAVPHLCMPLLCPLLRPKVPVKLIHAQRSACQQQASSSCLQ